MVHPTPGLEAVLQAPRRDDAALLRELLHICSTQCGHPQLPPCPLRLAMTRMHIWRTACGLHRGGVDCCELLRMIQGLRHHSCPSPPRSEQR
jgi:hypothetical protein